MALLRRLALVVLLSLVISPAQAFLLDNDTSSLSSSSSSSFRLTVTPSPATRGITQNVTMGCRHDGVTAPGLWEVTRIRIMRQTATSWDLFVQHTLAGNTTVADDATVDVLGAVTQNMNDTYLQVTWDVAGADTFGTFRCDVVGLDKDLNPALESTAEVTLPERAVTTGDLLTLLLQTREEMSGLARDVNRRLDALDREMAQVKDDALFRDDVASWPAGHYALLRPRLGCPVDLTFQGGDESYFTLHTESSSGSKNGNSYSKAMPLSTTTKLNGNNLLFTLRFCEARREFTNRRWPSGSYCISKIPGQACPSGLSEGAVTLDAEDTNTTNDLRGNVVTEFGDRAKFEFCCRDTGSASYRMRLPTYSPFILYRKGGACQQVYGMKVSQETITIDTEDNNNGDTVSGSVPDVSIVNISSKPVRFALCYYIKL